MPSPFTDADKAKLAFVLPLLDDESLSVLQHRFGLGGRHQRTPAQVGHLLGLTVIAVCRIEAAALAYLREAMRPKWLDDGRRHGRR